MEEIIRMKDIINSKQETCEFEDVTEPKSDSRIHMPVLHVDVEPIVIEEVEDSHGRLSDIVDNLMEVTGQSVVPFNMCGISNNVIKLQRHEIITLGDKKFAMSTKPRLAVVNDFRDRIISVLKSGVSYSEILNRSITYNSNLYTTLALSACEWSYVLSYFKNYKQDVFADVNGNIVLEVDVEFAE